MLGNGNKIEKGLRFELWNARFEFGKGVEARLLGIERVWRVGDGKDSIGHVSLLHQRSSRWEGGGLLQGMRRLGRK